MISVICAPRMAGKTHTLIHKMERDADLILVVPTRLDAVRISQQYRIDPKRIVPVAQRASLSSHVASGRLLIDDLDRILAEFFVWIPIETATTTSIAEAIPNELDYHSMFPIEWKATGRTPALGITCTCGRPHPNENATHGKQKAPHP